MHLPNSWGNPERTGKVAAWLRDEAGENVAHGIRKNNR
jgi:hypothetical protein